MIGKGRGDKFHLADRSRTGRPIGGEAYAVCGVDIRYCYPDGTFAVSCGNCRKAARRRGLELPAAAR